MPLYANIAVNAYSPTNLGTFTYAIPDEYAEQDLRGSVVRVPFGNKQAKGVIVELLTSTPDRDISIKPITQVIEGYPKLLPWQLDLVRWLAEYYHCSLHLAVRTVAPFLFSQTDKFYSSTKYVSRTGLPSDGHRLGAKQQLTLDLLTESGRLSIPSLRDGHGISSSTVNSLAERGLLELTIENSPPQLPILSDLPSPGIQIVPIDPIKLSGLKPHLIHSSGPRQQTAAILQIAQQAGKTHRQILIVVPEISQVEPLSSYLAELTVPVSIWHSELTDRQRFAVWEQAQSGQLKVIIGTRSSLFLPFVDLDTVIIVDEHNPQHKQFKNPRYHARTVAFKLCQLLKSKLVLLSPTPSIESYYHAQQGTYHLRQLIRDQLPLQSNVRLIDLTRHRLPKRSSLSQPLLQSIASMIDQNKLVALFINRRGAARSVLCRDCGHIFSCASCNSPYVYHQTQTLFRCHVCGHTEHPAEQCPSCQGSNIQYRGSGTQTVEKELAQLYPDACIRRVDSDSISSLQTIRTLHSEITNRQIDILVGTQLLANLQISENIGLIGVLQADQSLMLPDFRAGERTFERLSAFISLAEQSNPVSEVVIQTYQPDNIYIQAALAKDYKSFYRQEIVQRQQAGYPPFKRLILLSVEDPNDDKAAQRATVLKRKLEKRTDSSTKISGPFPAYTPRQRGQYVHHLLLAGDKPHALLELVPNQVSVVVDPLELL